MAQACASAGHKKQPVLIVGHTHIAKGSRARRTPRPAMGLRWGGRSPRDQEALGCRAIGSLMCRKRWRIDLPPVGKSGRCRKKWVKLFAATARPFPIGRGVGCPHGRQHSGGCRKGLAGVRPRKPVATRKASGIDVAGAGGGHPAIVGGSADLDPSKTPPSIGTARSGPGAMRAETCTSASASMPWAPS
jgi:transketolase